MSDEQTNQKKCDVIVSIFDRKAEQFNAPCVCRNRATASRMFEDLCKRDERFKSHPEDYVLYLVGYFDYESGSITTVDRPEWILGAMEVSHE